MISFEYALKSIGKEPHIYSIYWEITPLGFSTSQRGSNFSIRRHGATFGPFEDLSDPIKYDHSRGNYIKNDWSSVIEALRDDDISALDKVSSDLKDANSDLQISGCGYLTVTLRKDETRKTIYLKCNKEGVVFIDKGSKGIKYKGPQDVIKRLEKEIESSLKTKQAREKKKAEEFAKRAPSISKLIMALIKERGFRTQEHDKYVKVLTKLGSINIFFSRDPIEISGNFGWLKSKFRLADPNNKPIENITNLLDKIKDFENHLKDNYV